MSASAPPAALDRAGRKTCWEARDAFFQCLNVHNVAVPPEGASKGKGGDVCVAERERYERDCPKSWVSGRETAGNGSKLQAFAVLALACLAISLIASIFDSRQTDYFNKRRVLEVRRAMTEDAARKSQDDAQKTQR
jgi:hypothetical protein